MKIIVCGKARSGKTTAAKILAELFECEFGDTGAEVAKVTSALLGVSEKAIAENKEFYRPKLIMVGDSLCKSDPASLSKHLFKSGSLVVSGVRKLKELRALREEIPDLLVVWVSRDSKSVSDNLTVSERHCDVSVDNNGSEGDLRENLLLALSSLGGRFS